MTDSDTWIPFAKACRLVPGRVSLSTLHRWRLHGVRGVRLRSWKVGGRRFTSPAAIQEFIRELTRVQDGAAPPQSGQEAPDERVRRAERELDREGV